MKKKTILKLSGSLLFLAASTSSIAYFVTSNNKQVISNNSSSVVIDGIQRHSSDAQTTNFSSTNKPVFSSTGELFAYISSDNKKISIYKLSDGSKVGTEISSEQLKSKMPANLMNDVSIGTFKVLTFFKRPFDINNPNQTDSLLAVFSGTDSGQSKNYMVLVKINTSNAQVEKVFQLNGNMTDADSFAIDGSNGFIGNNAIVYGTKLSGSDLKLSRWTVDLSKNENPVSGTGITSSQDTFKTYLESSSKLVTTYSSGPFFNFVYADGSKSDGKWLTVLRVNQTTFNGSNINASNFINLKKPKEWPSTMSPPESGVMANINVVEVAQNNNEQYLLLTNKSETAGKAYVYKYNNDSFTNSLTIDPNELTSTDLNNQSITSLTPLYGSDNNVTGFAGLVSDKKKILRFDATFSTNPSLLFNTASPNPSGGSSSDINNKELDFLFSLRGDTSWYGYKNSTENTIYRFSGSNFSGKVSSSNASNAKESVANVSFKLQKDINQTLLMHLVGDAVTSGNSSTQTFKNFITNNINDFVDINSFDLVFGRPKLIPEVISSTKDNSSNNYKVTIKLEQQLRKIDNRVVSDDNGNKVLLGYQTYTFTNEEVKLEVRKPDEIDFSLKQKLPSQITANDLNRIIDVKNGGNYDWVIVPNDTEGTLTARFISQAVWEENTLKANYTKDIAVGSNETFLFKKDLFNGLSDSVELITESYLRDKVNLKTDLSTKYSNTLPSAISKKAVLDDFTILGDAFKNQQLLSTNVITLPKDEDISIIPVDKEGYLLVTINFPKIGELTNVKYTFETAKVFRQNFTAASNSIIAFIDNDEVLRKEQRNGENQLAVAYSQLLPTTLQGLILGNNRYILNFVNVSNYLLNEINKNNLDKFLSLTVIPNNSLGTLRIVLTFKDQIPGLENQSIAYTYSGFQTSGAQFSLSENNYPTFKWGTLPTTALQGKLPQNITAQELLASYANLFVLNGAANQLRREVTVTPLSASGAVLVRVKFFDWFEKIMQNGRENTVLRPEKTFSTVLTNGLRQSRDSINLLVWKSFEQLGAQYQTLSPSAVVSQINTTLANDIQKLQVFSDPSNSLLALLNQPTTKLALSLTPNDALGTIDVFARITTPTQDETLSTKISNFGLVSSNYNVSLATQTDEKVIELLKALPSEITTQQIEQLIDLNLRNGLTKQITTTVDDANGTLRVQVDLLGRNSNQVLASTSRTYSGFATSQPQYEGNDPLIIGLSALIPSILFAAIIIYITLIKNKLDVRKFAKVLDVRVRQASSKKKSSGKVSSLQELLDYVDTDK